MISMAIIYSGIKNKDPWHLIILSASLLILCIHPHIFANHISISLIFFCIFLSILFIENIPISVILLLLLPAQIIWSNISPYAVLGPIFMVLFLISAIASIYFPLPFEMNKNLIIPKQKLVYLSLTCFLIISGALISPAGIKILSSFHSVLQNTQYGFGSIFNAAFIIGISAIFINLRYNNLFYILSFSTMAILAYIFPDTNLFFLITSTYVFMRSISIRLQIGYHPILKNALKLLSLCAVILVFLNVNNLTNNLDYCYKKHMFESPVYNFNQDYIPSGLVNYLKLIKYSGVIINTSPEDGDYIYFKMHPSITPTRMSYPFNPKSYEIILSNVDIQGLYDLCRTQRINAIYVSNKDAKYYETLLLYLYKSRQWAIAREDINGVLFLKSGFIKTQKIPVLPAISLKLPDITQIGLNNINVSPLLDAAETLLAMKKIDPALKIITYANLLSPSPKGKFLYAKALFITGHYKKSWAILRQILKAKPGNEQEYKSLAIRALCRAGNLVYAKTLASEEISILSKIELLAASRNKAKIKELTNQYIRENNISHLKLNMLLEKVNNIQQFYKK